MTNNVYQPGDKEAYKHGFVKRMKDIQNHTRTDMRTHTDSYAVGYADAESHFKGLPCNEVAYELGLIKIYRDFYGQSDFSHPF